jgi:hypothetical protein
MSIKELLIILQGDWRGYYLYGTGNRARDQGEAFVHISSEAVKKGLCRIMIKGKGQGKWGTSLSRVRLYDQASCFLKGSIKYGAGHVRAFKQV